MSEQKQGICWFNFLSFIHLPEQDYVDICSLVAPLCSGMQWVATGAAGVSGWGWHEHGQEDPTLVWRFEPRNTDIELFSMSRHRKVKVALLIWHDIYGLITYKTLSKTGHPSSKNEGMVASTWMTFNTKQINGPAYLYHVPCLHTRKNVPSTS